MEMSLSLGVNPINVPTKISMKYLSLCRDRDEKGAPRPIAPVANYRGSCF